MGESRGENFNCLLRAFSTRNGVVCSGEGAKSSVSWDELNDLGSAILKLLISASGIDTAEV